MEVHPKLAPGIQVNKFSDTITWVFADDQERRLYLSTRRSVWYEILAVVGFFIAYAAYIYLLGGDLSYTIGASIGGPAIFAFVIWQRRSRWIKGVEIDFTKKQIVCSEILSSSWIRWRRVYARILAKYITAMSWGADGILIERWKAGRQVTFFLS
ncbi:MAG TPA: hypothetical protein VNI20_00810, partial [Fimbriimonadaceae bacterium]|nr:hypothetical protein [Fimbriimonadaceae bacterium]